MYSIIHRVRDLWPTAPLTAERFCYCLSSNNVLASSDMDYSYSPICNPTVDGLDPSSAKERTLPGVTVLSSPPLQHPCLHSIVIPWVITLCQRWAFLTLVLQLAVCFLIHQGGSSGWPRQDYYCDSDLHGRQEWEQRSRKIVRQRNGWLILNCSLTVFLSCVKVSGQFATMTLASHLSVNLLSVFMFK